MADFIVIGGGIAGTSVAARLSALGTVTLLERETALGYHASGRSAALFESHYGLQSTVALSKASADFHATAHGGFLSPRGLMFVAAPGDKAAFARACDDFHVTPISMDEARAKFPILNPDTVGLAAFHEAAYDIDTDRQIQTFARSVRENGGTVLTGQDVTAITRTAHGWEVATRDQTHSAPMLVNAAGAWAASIAELAGAQPLGITPYRRTVAQLRGEVDAPDDMPLVLDISGSFYFKSDNGRIWLSPHDETPTTPCDAAPEEIDVALAIDAFENATDWPIAAVERKWAGLRSFAPDRLPIYGADPELPGFLWFAGQGGFGIQTAPAAARLMAQMTLGNERDELTRAIDARVYTPLRFYKQKAVSAL